MSSGAGTAGRRARWLPVLAILLFASPVAPVLAAESAPVASFEDTEIPALPDGQDMQEAMAAAERAAEDQARWLQSPEAVQQREESRHAFAGIDPAAAEQRLLSTFAEQFQTLNGDPARILSDARLLQPLGAEETAATVEEQGDSLLLEAGIPVRAADEGGDLSKVSLALEATSEGFEPVNPLTELSIPDSAGEAIEVGEEGLAICYSGMKTDLEMPSGIKCGNVVTVGPLVSRFEGRRERKWCLDKYSLKGDSGSPVWIEGTNTAVGILSTVAGKLTCFIPLAHDAEYPNVRSVFGDTELGKLSLVLQP